MIYILLLMILGCSAEPPKHDAHDAHDDVHTEHDAHEAEGAPNDAPEEILKVSDDLRRDLRVSTVVASAQTGAERVVVLGEVHAHEDALAAIVAPVDARIVRVRAQTGATVAAGEALVDLESVAVGQARAALLSARAELLRAEQTWTRKRELSEVVSHAELESAAAEVSIAHAALRAAEAELRALGVGTTLSDPVDGRFSLRTPLAGVVLERAAIMGAVVDPEEVLFRVADLNRLQVEVHAFERDAVRLLVGAHADVTVSALPGVTFGATVVRVGGEVNVTSRTMPVRINVQSDGRLRPGMAATASLDTTASSADIVSVPAAALQRFEGGWVVFIPKEKDAFEIRPVGRGRDLGAQVEILSGLNAGETVVLDGAFLLKAEAEKRQGGGEGHHEH